MCWWVVRLFDGASLALCRSCLPLLKKYAAALSLLLLKGLLYVLVKRIVKALLHSLGMNGGLAS